MTNYEINDALKAILCNLKLITSTLDTIQDNYTDNNPTVGSLLGGISSAVCENHMLLDNVICEINEEE